MPGRTFDLLIDATATGAGTATGPIRENQRTFQVFGSVTTGTGTVTVQAQVRNHVDAPWKTLGSATLALTTAVSSDEFTSSAPWAFIRANVTVISGTGAKVSLVMGV